MKSLYRIQQNSEKEGKLLQSGSMYLKSALQIRTNVCQMSVQSVFFVVYYGICVGERSFAACSGSR